MAFMSLSGESETIEQLLKMSWTFMNDRYTNQFAAVIFVLYANYYYY